MSYFVMDGDLVVNVAVAAPDFAAAQGWLPAVDGVGIGWRVQGGGWQPPASPAPPVPAVVSMRQARLALLAAGLLDDVTSAIAAIPDAIARQAAQIEWDYAHEVHRTSPFVQQLGAALGLDDAALDALFVQAVTL